MTRFSLFFLIATLSVIASCKNETETSNNETEVNTSAPIKELSDVEKGQMIAGATFAALSGQLQKALSEGGVPNAIQYCNTAAMPIVDSLSKVHHAKIRRTSLKIRNPANDPTELEREMLDYYHEAATSGKELAPMTKVDENGATSFFAPIKVNELCLKCHGIPGKTLTMEDMATIHSFYPGDEAIGYVDGDLRGIWSIQLFE